MNPDLIPLWVVFGVLAVLASCVMPLIQEKRQVDSYALAPWNKIFTAILLTPFVMHYGLPDDPRFYLVAFLTSSLWCVADISYFRAIAAVGAGVVTRIIPSAIICTFILWFAVDPALLAKYTQNPAQSTMIAVIVVAAALLATRVKKCAVSWKAAHMILPVLFAATIGPILQKVGLSHVDMRQAPFAMTMMQSMMMVGIWGIFYAIKKPVSRKIFFSRHAIITGFMISLSSGTANVLMNGALMRVEHPAYLSVILLTDSALIYLYYRLTGKKDESNVAAGLGIVACAMALVIVKSM